jgi:intron-binding protein aquarius
VPPGRLRWNKRFLVRTLSGTLMAERSSRSARASRAAGASKAHHEGQLSHADFGVTTTTELLEDPLTALAASTWASQVRGSPRAPCRAAKPTSPPQGDGVEVDMSLVASVYDDELGGGQRRFPRAKLQILEMSGYLEQYLVKAIPEPASKAAVGRASAGTMSKEFLLSVAAMLVEKDHMGVDVWASFSASQLRLQCFLTALLLLRERGLIGTAGDALTSHEACLWLQTLTVASQSLEVAQVRETVLRWFNLPSWTPMNPAAVEVELHHRPELRKAWGAASRQFGPTKRPRDDEEALASQLPATLVAGLVDDCLALVDLASSPSPPPGVSHVVERFLELFRELLLQFATRRFFRPVLIDRLFVRRVQATLFYRRKSESKLSRQLLDQIIASIDMDLDERTGTALTPAQVTEAQSSRLEALQRLAYLRFRTPLHDLTMDSIGALSDRGALFKHLDRLDDTQLRELAIRLCVLRPTPQDIDSSNHKRTKTVEDRSEPTNRLVDRAGQLLPESVVAILGGSSSSSAAKTVDGLPETVGVPSLEDLPRSLLVQVLLDLHARKPLLVDVMNETPLFPSDALLWDADRLPFPAQTRQATTMTFPLALPRLNLQFLSFGDYLMRNSELFKLESAYAVSSLFFLVLGLVMRCRAQIRDDIIDAVKRLQPRHSNSVSVSGYTKDTTSFGGWSRMAIPISTPGVSITRVKPPRLGDEHPAGVTARFEIELAPFAQHVREGWDELREGDAVFLLAIAAPSEQELALIDEEEKRFEAMYGLNRSKEETPTFPKRFGVRFVRGAEILQIRDENGVNLSDPFAVQEELAQADDDDLVVADDKKLAPPSAPKLRTGDVPPPMTCKRTITVRLDPIQYYADMRACGGSVEAYGEDAEDEAAAGQSAEGPYVSLNVFLRRDSKGNNFKAVLETLRDLVNHAAVSRAVPDWIRPVLLGRGNPLSAHYSNMPDLPRVLDVADTFVSASHAVEVLDKFDVTVQTSRGEAVPLDEADAKVSPPFRLVFDESHVPTGSSPPKVILREAPKRLPDPYGNIAPEMSGHNTVRFTRTQTEAIRAGMYPGLNVVVGPPGTGKTDVAVQIVTNLYRAYPTQTILLVTHSNQALNDLFDKIADKGGVDPRHLLRLGRGEADLKTEGDYSRAGRVEHSFERRKQVLWEVHRLALSIGLTETLATDAAYSCESAGYFRERHVRPLVDQFRDELREAKAHGAPAPTTPWEVFPFKDFFSNVPRGGLDALFGKEDFAQDAASAENCIKYVDSLFSELESIRPLELLRTQRQRVDYMLVKQARIVAMTCTHAAIARRHLLSIGFHFDTMVMEEAAQVMEVETIIPMLLQDIDPHQATPRLKRVTLIGDHNQLPPVVVNSALQRYSRLEQSMFARLIRLGVPHIQLDAQGRARPEIATLYNWRYKQLGDLPNVSIGRFSEPNPGFRHTFQFVNVPDFRGAGETSPAPHVFQNLGEAEFIVATFQYLCLVGVPPEKISILATYAGQRNLLRDVVAHRCRGVAPRDIETVDRFQGSQNDFVLVSLVRTKHIGHIRDPRRLTVALSRARLGLYVFGRRSMFETCLELSRAFEAMLRDREDSLQLLPPGMEAVGVASAPEMIELVSQLQTSG